MTLVLGEDYELWPKGWRWQAPIWVDFDKNPPVDMIEADEKLIAQVQRGIIGAQCPWGCARAAKRWVSETTEAKIAKEVERLASRLRPSQPKENPSQPKENPRWVPETAKLIGTYKTPNGEKMLVRWSNQSHPT